MKIFILTHSKDSKIQSTLLPFWFFWKSRKIKFHPSRRFLKSHDASLAPCKCVILCGWVQWSTLHRRFPNVWPDALSGFPLPCGSKSISPSLLSCHHLSGFCITDIFVSVKFYSLSHIASSSTTHGYASSQLVSIFVMHPSNNVLFGVSLVISMFGSPEAMSKFCWEYFNSPRHKVI